MDVLEISTAAGNIRGFWRAGSAAFLGIPYAEAPVGDARFAAPVPRSPWSGVRPALSYGPTPQRIPPAKVALIPKLSIAGDDILNLNVFTPAPGGRAKLPVMVYFHGGGYISGSA